ncbi:hypothetical protein M378DRAFT_423469 [Amanita muscaria Koide BX008]|uniref:Uncharacterized protein n=1 Tax=Amanita muscaria (strain Koide BX008) TaxID=946122 RepID=A0A0C2WJW5_AMAMK|nr:hypothetical protein M378DRAFT_423469 [Amanita muscaria Koide BX008]
MQETSLLLAVVQIQGSDSPQGPCTIPGSGAATATSATTANAPTPTKRSSIIPVSDKPPTQCLSKSAISNSSTPNPNSSATKPAVSGWSAARPYTHTSLASKDFDFRFHHHPSSASRFSISRGRRRRSYGKSRSGERSESAERDEWGEKEGHMGGESEDHDNDGALLTDRFRFVYDVSQYNVLLLLRARDCKSTAPACLTGVKIADRQEDNNWPDASDDRLEENDEQGDEEESFTGGGGTHVRSNPGGQPASISSRTTAAVMGRWLILSLDLSNMQKASDLRHRGRANGRAPLLVVLATATVTVRLSLADRLGRHCQQHCRFPRRRFLRLLLCCRSLPTRHDTRVGIQCGSYLTN